MTNLSDPLNSHMHYPHLFLLYTIYRHATINSSSDTTGNTVATDADTDTDSASDGNR